jgi:hypothetical protein
MSVLDFGRRRSAGLPRRRGPAPQATMGIDRQQSRVHAAIEVAGTLLVLTLIGVGILTLRFALVFAHSLLQ